MVRLAGVTIPDRDPSVAVPAFSFVGVAPTVKGVMLFRTVCTCRIGEASTADFKDSSEPLTGVCGTFDPDDCVSCKIGPAASRLIASNDREEDAVVRSVSDSVVSKDCVDHSVVFVLCEG